MTNTKSVLMKVGGGFRPSVKVGGSFRIAA